MTRFSIIVPVYNAQAYLDDCLDSACGQTFEDLEIICVNDGSTDESGDILAARAMADKRIRVIDKANGGPSSARNDGIRIAQGEYLCFLDADDLLEPFALERLDVAIDAAEVVLMKSRLSDVPAAIRLSRATLKNIHENLFWAFIYNVIGIPLAAGCYIGLFGWKLNPMFGAAAMSLSSFCVVSNALRLNLFKIHDARRDKRLKNTVAIEGNMDNNIVSDIEPEINSKEDTKMVKTMKIQGMMCGNCEKHVRKALEALDGVESAVVSHEAGTAVVTLSGDVADDVLKAAVEEEEYPVIGIE